MAEPSPYDEATWMENSVSEIHAAWERMRYQSSSGQKAWLTQMKNHYAKLIQADPEAAAELLAAHEYHSERP